MVGDCSKEQRAIINILKFTVLEIYYTTVWEIISLALSQVYVKNKSFKNLTLGMLKVPIKSIKK
jgi:hypothetical protein